MKGRDTNRSRLLQLLEGPGDLPRAIDADGEFSPCIDLGLKPLSSSLDPLHRI